MDELDVLQKLMRFARVIILLGFVASLALIASHWLGLPAYPIRGWLFAPRIEKEVYFSITGAPFDHESWTSRWGSNRPPADRPHQILSEVEVRIQHQSRSSLVVVNVTGDSEEDVDAFIQTLRSDVERTYFTNELLSPNHGYFQGDRDSSVETIFWRQRYLWLLIANAVVFFALWILLRRKKNPTAEQAGTGQPATRPESKSEGSDKPQPEAEGRSQ